MSARTHPGRHWRQAPISDHRKGECLPGLGTRGLGCSHLSQFSTGSGNQSASSSPRYARPGTLTGPNRVRVQGRFAWSMANLTPHSVRASPCRAPPKVVGRHQGAAFRWSHGSVWMTEDGEPSSAVLPSTRQPAQEVTANGRAIPLGAALAPVGQTTLAGSAGGEFQHGGRVRDSASA